VRLREIQVLEQILEGRTQHQIAASVGISQPAVSKIVRRLEERLLADLSQKAERHRARQTLRLEHLYGQAMEAWKESKTEGLRRRQRKTERDDGGGSTTAELMAENRQGDPRYLDEARKALGDLRKLWGIDAPERVSIDAVTPFAAMSDEVLALEVTRHLRLLHPPEPIDVPVSPTPERGNDEPQ
jgi:predicted transcriptional regulator